MLENISPAYSIYARILYTFQNL